MYRRTIVTLFALVVSGCVSTTEEAYFSEKKVATKPTNPIGTFRAATFKAKDKIYNDHNVTLYCSCKYKPNKDGTSGVVNKESCGYDPGKSDRQGVEWEHIVPARFFGEHRICWAKGHSSCVTGKGKKYKGRKCCKKVDKDFKRTESDLHNLAPSIGQLNGIRLDHPYGLVSGEKRRFGKCDFEVGGSPKLVEPMPSIRGDVARVWLYMSDTYGIKLSDSDRRMYEKWDSTDPVTKWEKKRDMRIKSVQGNSNPYVTE